MSRSLALFRLSQRHFLVSQKPTPVKTDHLSLQTFFLIVFLLSPSASFDLDKNPAAGLCCLVILSIHLSFPRCRKYIRLCYHMIYQKNEVAEVPGVSREIGQCKEIVQRGSVGEVMCKSVLRNRMGGICEVVGKDWRGM